MNSEYKLSNYTPKGWILKRALDVYNPINPAEFEKAIFAALAAAVEVGFLKEPDNQ